MLGGAEIPDHPGLAGHSDGDAVAHAVTDALLGAAGLGDIGQHFPPGDAQWAGADSMGLLGTAVELLHTAGYRVVNADVVVVTETPRISAHAPAMRDNLASTLRVDTSHVSVKGKTNEGMGWIGDGLGLAVHAVALVRAAEPPE